MLKAFPYPVSITALQFAVGSVIAVAMWLLGLHKKPEGAGEAVRQGPGRLC